MLFLRVKIFELLRRCGEMVVCVIVVARAPPAGSTLREVGEAPAAGLS